MSSLQTVLNRKVFIH